MRKLDVTFPDLSLYHYRVVVDDLFGKPVVYHFYSQDCGTAVRRLEKVQDDYCGFVVRFDTLCVFDDCYDRWEQCILFDEED